MAHKLTPAQEKALKLWADGRLHNETALRVHGTVYANLVIFKMLQREQFCMSRITDKGREALGLPQKES